VLGGAGKDLIAPALALNADVLVTGEVSYNARIDGAEMGLSIIEAGHFYTENPVIAHLCALAREISGVDAVPLTYDPTRYIV
jgi:putative NIF3 family GTP cyclohydrolase 1 type 2